MPEGRVWNINERTVTINFPAGAYDVLLDIRHVDVNPTGRGRITFSYPDRDDRLVFAGNAGLTFYDPDDPSAVIYTFAPPAGRSGR